MSSSNPSRWIKILSQPGTVRGVAVQATEIVREIANLHQIKGAGAVALGEALVSGLLVASYCKTGERINLNIQGAGRFGHALVDANPEGHVRGYVAERSAVIETPLPKNQRGATGPWGEGLLSVLRTKGEEGKPPYVGTVPLLTGFLAKDITFYWLQSEQIPSATGLTVTTDPKTGEVTSAGGFLVQALPGASTTEVASIERHIRDLESLATTVAENGDPMDLLARIFESTSFVILEERELVAKCTCSWERVERALRLVGVAELRAMAEGSELPIVRCDFCAKEYAVTREALTSMLARVESEEANS